MPTPLAAMVVLDDGGRMVALSPDAAELIDGPIGPLPHAGGAGWDDLFGPGFVTEATPMIDRAGRALTALMPRPAAAAARPHRLADVPWIVVAWPNGRTETVFIGTSVGEYLGVRGSPGGADWIGLWRQAVHRDDRAAEAQFAARAEHGDPSVARYRVVAADGTVRWVRDTAAPRREPDGRVLVFAVISELDPPVRHTAVLSRRQEEVLRLVAEGVSTRAIATRLELSPSTVRNHIAAILRELSSHSRLEAVARAREKQLI